MASAQEGGAGAGEHCRLPSVPVSLGTLVRPRAAWAGMCPSIARQSLCLPGEPCKSEPPPRGRRVVLGNPTNSQSSIEGHLGSHEDGSGLAPAQQGHV